jgi:hypothetical protein
MQIMFAREFGTHLEAIFGRQLLDQAAHLSVADDGKA